MSSIYPRPNTKNLECAFYVPQPDGTAKKVRRSTGTTNRREARRRAERMEADARRAAGLSGETAAAIHAVVVKAGEEAVKERLTAARAREFIEEILKLSGGEELKEFTVRAWTNEWLKRKRDQVSKATLARYNGSCRSFISWLGEMADKPLTSVSTTHLRQYRDTLREGRTARTCNAYLKDVSSIFGAAVDEGLISSNPVKPLKPLPLTDSTERTPFTPGEVERLVRAAPSDDWKGVTLLGAYTGLRLGDCSSLKWGNVDLAAGTLTLIPKKTKRKRVEVKIPLAGPLREFFEHHPIADDPDIPIFPTLYGIPVSGKTGLSIAFGKIMDSAEVSRGQKHASGMHDRGFHALRHTFTSWLANAGVSSELREAMTGHLDSESHKLYTHHEIAALENAINKLPGLSEVSK
ncbi:MAG: tyrosine-type recombinase/integrase [Verrucomicrobiota bacterium]